MFVEGLTIGRRDTIVMSESKEYHKLGTIFTFDADADDGARNTYLEVVEIDISDSATSYKLMKYKLADISYYKRIKGMSEPIDCIRKKLRLATSDEIKEANNQRGYC